MAILFKKGTVFAPKYLGVCDVLVVGNRIEALAPDLAITMPQLEIVDAKGLILTPGMIDQHVHVTGGGGEGGPQSRTPEILLSELVACGTTTVIGVAGTDSVTRSIEALLAKVRALTAEGVSAWMYTSNYALPPSLLTASVRQDIFCIPEVLGVKIAMGDHRSSFPTLHELLRIVSDIRVASMIAGKIGFLHVHLGDLSGPFALFNEMIEQGLPAKHFRPTHCARDKKVFEEAMTFAKQHGGVIDVTSGGSCFETPAGVIKLALQEGVKPDLITMSTDGHGSIPRFDAQGTMIGLGVGTVSSNLESVKAMIALDMKPELAFSFVTSNVATHLGLPAKGFVREGSDADLCLFDQHFELQDVMAKGRFLMRGKEIMVKGTFEE